MTFTIQFLQCRANVADRSVELLPQVVMVELSEKSSVENEESSLCCYTSSIDTLAVDPFLTSLSGCILLISLSEELSMQSSLVFHCSIIHLVL